MGNLYRSPKVFSTNKRTKLGGIVKKQFMKEALKEAIKAKNKQEVPVGAVIVLNNKIIARGHNIRETKNNSLCHAEIIAINKACKKLHNFRLEDCEMYVTLEPCLMCVGAIIQSRIKKVVIGAKDPKYGMAGTTFNAFELKSNHKVEAEFGILEEECSSIIKEFFKKLRENHKNNNKKQ